MPTLSPKVDDYIDAAPAYAKPILLTRRKLFHKACPQLEETIKWSVPHFEYKGVLAGVSAHKNHINIVFWKASLMQDPHGLFESESGGAMTRIRIEAGGKIPSDATLLAYIRQAVQINESGLTVSKPKPKTAKKPLGIPPDLAAAIKGNKQANAAFEAFSPSHRREYVEWITDAKRQETRDRRIVQALEWIAAGKSRNWKYERSSQ